MRLNRTLLTAAAILSGISLMLLTAGKPAAIRLSADRHDLAADGRDMAFVVIEIVDADGNRRETRP